ncbi:hypothetical protein TTHERM_00670440 (macronuclear) [Tetrahymena thermophila SB210]|uniref:Uncharacterized protein n=1 Tax=Tetrahymena thermophila (strain SB210) TaxID=312017 RepID=I7LXS8_TETTS|nr:hypothetical protein TTHERM_00670440 [Tetrahymena thermophila SB210]EAS06120.1 hypothetical protein TTHERM_00670440 [Tetrahymena thermophila SB210]|eukprot:XP_001026365.1 hypothetical protein TTHERM_00670440 [Tetrahymena thermophila SB210]
MENHILNGLILHLMRAISDYFLYFELAKSAFTFKIILRTKQLVNSLNANRQYKKFDLT